MKLHSVDVAIIGIYLASIVVAGVLLSRRAAKNMDSYFLGGRTLPWYVLGVSNASGMFDITGTMWMVALLFMYGLKSVWIPWLWPSFNQIFLMVFLAAWLRRSNVLTGAEWLRTRFGAGVGLDLSHLSIVLFALISVIGFLAYAFEGIGKFAVVFLPWEFGSETYALIFMTITAAYVIVGGMYSVVVTDIIQFLLLTVVSFWVAGIALSRTTGAQIMEAVPDGWTDVFFGWHLNLDWSSLVPQVNETIASEAYELFGIFFMMVLFKGVLASMAGPAPNYDMQRVLATKTAREASLMSAIVSPVLVFPRYFLIAGITVLALTGFSAELNRLGSEADFEQLLPFVIERFMPVGLVGLILAGLLAAFMSTFDSTVNAGAAYLVNDVYKRYLRPSGAAREYVVMSYLSSILVVAVGIYVGFQVDKIDRILTWITAGLYGGYVIPNFLKWYWWRLNGIGYFLGMMVGIVLAIVAARLFPALTTDAAIESTQDTLHDRGWNALAAAYPAIIRMKELLAFPVILMASGTTCIVASLCTRPDDKEVLKKFYRQVQPWGWWNPVYQWCREDDPDLEPNRCFWRDMTNCGVGIVWQLSMAVLPILIVIQHYRSALWWGGVLMATTVFLKWNWYDRLPR